MLYFLYHLKVPLSVRSDSNNVLVKLQRSLGIDGIIKELIQENLKDWKYMCNLFNKFISPGFKDVLEDVSTAFIDNLDPTDPLKRETTREKLLKSWCYTYLSLQCYHLYCQLV